MSERRKRVGSGDFEEDDEENLEEDEVEGPLTSKNGLMVLKISQKGIADEKRLYLTEDRRGLKWRSNYFSRKFGKVNRIPMSQIIAFDQKQATKPFEIFQKAYGKPKASNISIIYVNDKQQETSLDIVVSRKSDFAYLMETIKTLYGSVKGKSKKKIDGGYLSKLWEGAEVDKDGMLHEQGVINMINKMGLGLSLATIGRIFKRVDVDKSGLLDFEEFKHLVDILMQRPELDALWSQIVKGFTFEFKFTEPFTGLRGHPMSDRDNVVSLTEFAEYWREINGENIGPEKLFKICSKYDAEFSRIESDPPITWSLWETVITSEDNAPISLEKKGIYQPFDQPLSSYFIASSYRTYLTKSSSQPLSVDRYNEDLNRGFRCVHAKVWDAFGGSLVVHDGDAVSPLKFQDVINTIKESAFKTNPYPVILSLSIYCGASGQKAVARILQDTLQSFLYTADASTSQRLPPPINLTEKILIMASHKMLKKDGSDVSKKTLVKELSSLIAVEMEYPGVDFTPNAGTAANVPPTRAAAVSYTSIKESGDFVQNFVDYNRGLLSFVFDDETASNGEVSPAIAISAGCQMVAANLHSPSISTFLAIGRALDNGGCGYSLRPDNMVLGKNSVAAPAAIRIVLNVVSAFRLPRQPRKTAQTAKSHVMDPFVVISVNGDSADAKEVKTNTILDNGLNPLWNEVFSFTIRNPEVATIVFTVYDSESSSVSTFSSFAAYPVRILAQGLRSIPLLDGSGVSSGFHKFASLLVRINIDPIVDDNQSLRNGY